MDKICYKCGAEMLPITPMIPKKNGYPRYQCPRCGEIVYSTKTMKQMEKDREKDKMEIVFKHGALAGTYEEQANEQGFTFGENAELIQSIGDSILQVYDEDLVNSKEYDQILEAFHRKRLTNKKYLKRLENK